MRFAVCYHFAIKSGIFKPKILCLCGFSDFTIYSHSIATKQFCLPNIVRAICVAFDYLIDPYYPAYQPSHYRFVITVDNGRQRLWINTLLV